MAVYLFTLHAYRSWMPDHRRGFVLRGKGIQRPDAQRAQQYHARARHDRMVFTDALGDQIIAAAREQCHAKGWRLHAAVVVWTHAHLVVSWNEFHDVKRVRAVLKRAITIWLRDLTGQQRMWLARGGSLKRVRDRQHYLHLTQRYLPAHRRFGGRQWYAHEQRAEPRRGRRG